MAALDNERIGLPVLHQSFVTRAANYSWKRQRDSGRRGGRGRLRQRRNSYAIAFTTAAASPARGPISVGDQGCESENQ